MCCQVCCRLPVRLEAKSFKRPENGRSVPGTEILAKPQIFTAGLRPRLEQAATLQDLQDLAHYQRQLLEAALKLLAPGGALVYSTCTLNPGVGCFGSCQEDCRR